MENISSKLFKVLSKDFPNLVPFTLLGDKRGTQENKFNTPLAVYSPLALSIKEEESLKLYYKYLLRRRSSKDSLRVFKKDTGYLNWDLLPEKVQRTFDESLKKYTLTDANLFYRFNQFKSNNVRLVVGASPTVELTDFMISQFSKTLVLAKLQPNLI